MLGDMRDTFDEKLLAHNQAQEAAKAATIAKNDSRADIETLIRQMRDL